MDYLAILEQYGIPLVVAIAFWFFIQKQNKYIQDELSKEMRESFSRVEGIIIKLIDQQKVTQMDVKQVKGYIEGIEHILAKLTGNGLKK